MSSSNLYAQVLNISGTTITGSTEVTAHNAPGYAWVETLSATQVLAVGIVGTVGKAVVLDVSGSTITPGTVMTFAATANDDICVTVLSSSKAIIGYGASDVAYAVVADIASSVITVGAVQTLHSGRTYNVGMARIDATSAVFALHDQPNSGRGLCYPLSVSGTTITTGTAVVFETLATFEAFRVEPVSAGKVVVCWTGGTPTERQIRYCILNYASNVITADAVVVVNTDASSALSRQAIAVLTPTKFAVAWSCLLYTSPSPRDS